MSHIFEGISPVCRRNSGYSEFGFYVGQSFDDHQCNEGEGGHLSSVTRLILHHILTGRRKKFFVYTVSQSLWVIVCCDSPFGLCRSHLSELGTASFTKPC